MTRFARKVKAHGVTHREPNEATPWSELRATLQPRFVARIRFNQRLD